MKEKWRKLEHVYLIKMLKQLEERSNVKSLMWGRIPEDPAPYGPSPHPEGELWVAYT